MGEWRSPIVYLQRTKAMHLGKAMRMVSARAITWELVRAQYTAGGSAAPAVSAERLSLGAMYDLHSGSAARQHVAEEKLAEPHPIYGHTQGSCTWERGWLGTEGMPQSVHASDAARCAAMLAAPSLPARRARRATWPDGLAARGARSPASACASTMIDLLPCGPACHRAPKHCAPSLIP